MEKKITLILLLVCSFVFSQEFVTTSTGNGADSYIVSQNPAGNYGSEDRVLTKDLNFGLFRKAYIKFDLSSLSGLTVLDAALNITYMGGAVTSNTVGVYGILDSADLDDWSETTICGHNAPGNSSTTNGFNSDAVFLGNITVASNSSAGDIFVFSNQNLIDFINADTDGLITIAMNVVTSSNTNIIFATKENTSYSSPSLEIEDGTVRLSDFTSVSDAFDYSDDGQSVLFVDEDYDAGVLSGCWNDLTIYGDGVHEISGEIRFEGEDVKRGATEYSNSDNTWLPVGTTLISLSSTPPTGSKLVMQTTLQSASHNQCGLEFLYVRGTSGGDVIIDTDNTTSGNQGITTEFYNPKLYNFSGLQYNTSLSKGATSIPGSWWGTWFSAGDFARIENYAGDDSVTGDKHYFENVKIISVDSTGMTFEPISSYYDKPYIAKADFGKNLTIENTAIEKLSISSYEQVEIDGLETQRLGFNGCYDIDIRNVDAHNTGQDTPRVVGFTFCKKAIVRDISASGATGSADNGNIKFMSPIDFDVDGLDAGYSYSFSSQQAIMGVFGDFYYVPYCTWSSNCSFDSITADKPSAGPSISVWFVGFRDSIFSYINSEAITRFYYSDNIILSGSNYIGMNMDCMGVDNSEIDFNVAGCLSVTDCYSTDFTGDVFSDTLQYGRNVWVRGYSEDITLDDINSSSTATNTFIYLQQVDGITISNCSDQDRDNSSWSLYKGSDVYNLTTTNNNFNEQVSP